MLLLQIKNNPYKNWNTTVALFPAYFKIPSFQIEKIELNCEFKITTRLKAPLASQCNRKQVLYVFTKNTLIFSAGPPT